MNAQQLASWAVERGFLLNDMDDSSATATLCKIAKVGPKKAYRWAVCNKSVPVFTKIMRSSLMKRLRAVFDEKARQISVIIIGSEPSHPSSFGSRPNLVGWYEQQEREGRLVFNRGSHFESYVA